MASTRRRIMQWCRRAVTASAVGVLVSCGVPGAFACTEHDQCLQGSVSGTCEPSGYCSFPDPACSSGSRYGSLAASELGGQCVEPPSSTTVATADPATSVGTTEPLPETTSNPVTGATTGSDESSNSGQSSGPSSSCGDGEVGPTEVCDDGNENDGDGCNNDCVESGTVLWSEYIVGDGNGYDTALSLGVSPSDQILICGRMFNDTFDGFVSQYVDDALAWTYMIDLQGGSDSCEGVDVDGAGRVIAVGSSGGSVELPFVIALDADGGVLVTAHPEVEDPSLDSRAASVALGPDGTVAIGGGNGDDAFLAAYDQTGQLVWSQHLPSAAGESLPHGLAFAGETLLAVGWQASVTTGNDFWVAAYDDGGQLLWQDIVDGEMGGSSDDRFHALAVLNGTATVVGRTGGDPNALVAATYGIDGPVIQWLDLPASTVSSARDIAFMPNGDAIIVGWETAEGSTNTDGWVRRYTPGGELRWEQLMEPRADADEFVTSVGVLSTGDIVVAGYLDRATTDAFVARLAP